MGKWNLNLELAANFLTVSLLQLLAVTLILHLSPAPKSDLETASGQAQINQQAGVKRFLLLWSALFISYVIGTAFMSVYMFKHLDLRYVRYFQLIAIPLVQSLVLIWVIIPNPGQPVKLAFRQVFSHAGVVGLLLLSIALQLVGMTIPHHEYLGVLGEHSIQPTCSALQLAIAGIVAIVLFRKVPCGRSDKIWIAIFVCMALAIAINSVLPWIDKIPLLAKSFNLRFIQAKLTTPFFFIVSVVVLVRVGQQLRFWSRGTGILFDIAIIILFLVANKFILDLYQPYPTALAQSLNRTAMTIANTCILAGILLSVLTARSLSSRHHAGSSLT